MKHQWLNRNGIKDNNNNMQSGGDFIGREYHIEVMDNLQYDRPKKVKRFRSAFTTDQVNYLEKQFKKFPYIGNAHRKEVALALNIPERAVKIWFQNRRMKEKKESTSKEFDDEQGIRKCQESKDQLNNVVPSTNEQARSLPVLTNWSRGNCFENIGINNSTSCDVTRPMVQGITINDSAAKLAAPVTQNVVTTAKVIHPPSVFLNTSQSPPDFKTSAEFSIDLCKRYKTDSLAKPYYVKQQTCKSEPGFKKIEEPKSLDFVEQMMPEDLSSSRKMNIPAMGQQQAFPGNASSNPGFVSLVPAVSPFYTQPYIPASGVIWKPVSVMPIVTSSPSPVSAPNNPLFNVSTVQENFTKRACNCDCHVKQVMPQVPYNFPQQSSSPQYIITAMPFQNPSTKF